MDPGGLDLRNLEGFEPFNAQACPDELVLLPDPDNCLL
jgi:hypothetical protein